MRPHPDAARPGFYRRRGKRALDLLLVLAALEFVRTQLMIRLSSWLDSRLGGTVFASNVLASLHRQGRPSVQGLAKLRTGEHWMGEELA